MKLYHYPLSGHSHRVRLFLSLIGAEAELAQVDLGSGEHRAAPFLALNRFGQVPVLEDGDTIVSDSNAILVYLAKKYERSDWLPEDPAGAAAVQRCLSVAAGQIAYGPGAARLVALFNARFDMAEVSTRAHAILKLIDAELDTRIWIAASRPTLADVALYSYIARAQDGRIALSSYPAIQAWLARIETLPGFVPFSPEHLAAAA
ncbi:glutathione S-transferase [Novosphingobium indicum]|uniref:Glutathione S-transferase n=1 Tax=Novosphingobium indicum TaxID=462949 RepID=A0ABQ2JA29_9SPHN|nr:glutathione S-transferase [Novosphingobium indicum]GGN42400.1 glutathione S-transferase [Novosphingobium indicum]